jgi:hypothetical protein
MHLIEDADGAPLPDALQPGSGAWDVVYELAYDAAPDDGQRSIHAVMRAEEAMLALVPIIYPDGCV